MKKTIVFRSAVALSALIGLNWQTILGQDPESNSPPPPPPPRAPFVHVHHETHGSDGGVKGHIHPGPRRSAPEHRHNMHIDPDIPSFPQRPAPPERRLHRRIERHHQEGASAAPREEERFYAKRFHAPAPHPEHHHRMEIRRHFRPGSGQGDVVIHRDRGPHHDRFIERHAPPRRGAAPGPRSREEHSGYSSSGGKRAHLEEAIRHLEAAGLHETAEEVRREAKKIPEQARLLQEEGEGGDRHALKQERDRLQQEVEELRRRLHENREHGRSQEEGN